MTANGQKIKVVFRKGKPLTKVVLLVMIVLCTVVLLVIHSSVSEEKARIARTRNEIITQQQNKNSFQNKIDKLGSAEGYVDIAGEELGLYHPDTVIVDTE